MSASVIELISFIKEKHSVTSVSSPNGYPVRWIYQLEDPAAAGTLGAGALVVTTGLMMKDDPDTLGKMLTGLRDAMAAGLILVGGSFPPETIGSAGIPLFTMPAGTDIASLMYDCCHFLTRQEAKELTVVKAFKSTLMNGSVSDGAARYLEQHGYPAMTKYFVMCFRHGTSQTHAQSAIEPPSVPGTRSCMFRYADTVSFIVCTGSQSKCGEMAENIHMTLGTLSDGGFVGISDMFTSLDSLPMAYRQAVSASRTAAATRTGTVFYNGVGLFTLLRSVQDSREADEYVSGILGQIKSHDAAEHTDLLKTLKAYMRCGGSVQEAADMLGIHRNTVNNKIRFIKEHFGIGFDYPGITSLSVAIALDDMKGVRIER